VAAAVVAGPVASERDVPDPIQMGDREAVPAADLGVDPAVDPAVDLMAAAADDALACLLECAPVRQLADQLAEVMAAVVVRMADPLADPLAGKSWYRTIREVPLAVDQGAQPTRPIRLGPTRLRFIRLQLSRRFLLVQQHPTNPQRSVRSIARAVRSIARAVRSSHSQ
jgi:hypothetical protein